MNLNDYRMSSQLLDCSGNVTHTLFLEIDGTVEIRFAAGHSATVNPVTRTNLTPAITVHHDLMHAAGALARSIG